MNYLEFEWSVKGVFSHGMEHPHGWGMAFFYGNAVSLEKRPEITRGSMSIRMIKTVCINAKKEQPL